MIARDVDDYICSNLQETTLQNETTQIRTRSVFISGAVCVSDTERLCGLCRRLLCQYYSISPPTVFLRVTHLISFTNDRLVVCC
jgi:hypothetical protein